METIYRTKKRINNLHYKNNGTRNSLYLVNSLYLFPRRLYSDSSNLGTSNLVNPNLVTCSEQQRKEKKAEIYKKGFPAVFKDMSKMKIDNYLAITKFIVRPLALFSLKEVPGIYMITNKDTNKIYIRYIWKRCFLLKKHKGLNYLSIFIHF